ncbi:MAG: hypothetical protein QXR48_01650 [Candidatus Woesearchaeota archaeon]
MKLLKYIFGTVILILALMMYFTRSAGDALRLTLTLAGIWLLPGVALVHLLMPDLHELEKIIIGFFLGSSIVALILYFPSLIGIPSIRPVLGYALGIIGLVVLWRKQ